MDLVDFFKMLPLTFSKCYHLLFQNVTIIFPNSKFKQLKNDRSNAFLKINISDDEVLKFIFNTQKLWKM